MFAFVQTQLSSNKCNKMFKCYIAQLKSKIDYSLDDSYCDKHKDPMTDTGPASKISHLEQ